MSQISRKSFGDGETISVHCSKLPFLLFNGQNDAGRHGFVTTRAKKEAPATTTSALVLHPLFEQMLFVREFKADRMTGGAEAYTYLGTANYVKHEGSRPMNITWQLDRPIPAKFLKKTNKLVVG